MDDNILFSCLLCELRVVPLPMSRARVHICTYTHMYVYTCTRTQTNDKFAKTTFCTPNTCEIYGKIMVYNCKKK